MLYFVTFGSGRAAITWLLSGWGKTLKHKIVSLDYSELFRLDRIPLGSYVFTGHENLYEEELNALSYYCKALQDEDPNVLLLNHPAHLKLRYEHLRTFYETGINDFNVYRLDEARAPQRFPVFLRHESDHEGPISDLIHTPDELEQYIKREKCSGSSLSNWIISEFCDTKSEDGLYRKYGAFNIAGKIIPRHLLVSDRWMVKKSASLALAVKMLEEELTYVRNNPHQDKLREIFRLAGIDYGRIDYGYIRGEIRVFEINTNPQILKPGGSKIPERTPVKELFAQRLLEAFGELTSRKYPNKFININADCPLSKRWISRSDRIINLTNRIGLKCFETPLYNYLISRSRK